MTGSAERGWCVYDRRHIQQVGAASSSYLAYMNVYIRAIRASSSPQKAVSQARVMGRHHGSTRVSKSCMLSLGGRRPLVLVWFTDGVAFGNERRGRKEKAKFEPEMKPRTRIDCAGVGFGISMFVDAHLDGLSTLLKDTEPPHLSHLLTQSLLPVLTQHLQHHPKSVTDIWLLVLESESPALESTLAAGVSVACAALGDAGIELGGLGVGVSSALATTTGNVLVDPNGGESRSAAARMTLGVLPALDMVSDIWFTGCAKTGDVIRMLEGAVEAGAGTVHGKVGNALVVGGGSK
ncbi:hypothetical protein QFC21_006260 [Naganishia friedmannii]|uniref:Uncharacterized protein n=1 Tax=Naganishia friedmannii TaxID=89922 RepID=A0ACC2V5N0_9TREE|nr:hypothetical protein QFC21_006260 [Naganishia friedmannii]